MTDDVVASGPAASAPQNEETPSASPEPSAKVDPETLVLRGEPGRVVRFRRGAIIGIAAFASTAIVGAAWLALDPATVRIVAEKESRAEILPKAPGDALAGVPKSYGDVPKLGPPLPGDLGRPILEHRRSIEAGDTGMNATDSAAVAAQAAEAERQRRAAERKAARESGVMVQISGTAGDRAARSVDSASSTVTGQESEADLVLDQETCPQPCAGSDAFGRQRTVSAADASYTAAGDDPHSHAPATSSWTLSAGSVIAASLITGVNSDLPGLVTAQVTENAYDSATGRTLLIPQGARLIGSYDSAISFGQSRALIVWQRIVLPDGSSIRLDNLPATDAGGFAGLSDEVDSHSWELLKGVALSTLLGVGTELDIHGESDLVRAIRESTQQGAARAGDRMVSKSLDIQPTIIVRPGWPLRVVIHKDLVLRPWRGGRP